MDGKIYLNEYIRGIPKITIIDPKNGKISYLNLPKNVSTIELLKENMLFTITYDEKYTSATNIINKQTNYLPGDLSILDYSNGNILLYNHSDKLFPAVIYKDFKFFKKFKSGQLIDGDNLFWIEDPNYDKYCPNKTNCVIDNNNPLINNSIFRMNINDERKITVLSGKNDLTFKIFKKAIVASDSDTNAYKNIFYILDKSNGNIFPTDGGSYNAFSNLNFDFSEGHLIWVKLISSNYGMTKDFSINYCKVL